MWMWLVWMTIAMITICLVLYIYTFVQVYRGSRIKFVLWVLGLMIVSSIAANGVILSNFMLSKQPETYHYNYFLSNSSWNEPPPNVKDHLVKVSYLFLFNLSRTMVPITFSGLELKESQVASEMLLSCHLIGPLLLNILKAH